MFAFQLHCFFRPTSALLSSSFLDQIPFSRHVECDYGQARAYRVTYGRDESPEAQAFRQAARDLLEKGKRALDELGIRFWLSSGTCLGE